MSMDEFAAELVAKQETPEKRTIAHKWMEFVRWNIDEGWRDKAHLMVKVEAARIRIQGYRGAEWMRIRGYEEPMLAEVNEELLRQERIFGESPPTASAEDYRARAAGEA